MTTSQATPGLVFKARIQAEVYTASDGTRWRIRSSARGKRIIADSAQGYANKADAFRGLLLVTGGSYTQLYRHVYKDGVYEQGAILRRIPDGPVEDIFVQYLSAPEATS